MFDQKELWEDKTLEELNNIRAITDFSDQIRKLWNFTGRCDEACNTSSISEILTESIVTKKQVCDTIATEANQGNLASIGCLTEAITDFNADFFYVDGYGNFATITDALMEVLIDDIETCIKEGCS